MNGVAKRNVRLILWTIPLLIFCVGTSVADPARTSGSRNSEIMAAGYIGSEACETCHEDQAISLAKIGHGRTSRTTWDGVSGCESCHGPGKAHADSGGEAGLIRNLKEIPGSEVSEVCLECHEKGERRHWQHSPHSSRNLSCITCHQIHHEGDVPEALLAKGGVFETCTSCHLQKKAAVMRSAHMPIREGGITCTDCHNPHGSLGPSQLHQFSQNENCYSCHAEKRAPVLWEHPPVRENCLNCHDPHGSLNSPLLKARRPWLCQQCHDEARHPTQPWDSAQSDSWFPTRRAHFNKGCLNCHSKIHGSNHPSGVRFMR